MAKEIKLSDGSTYKVRDVSQPTISSRGRRYFGTQRRDARSLKPEVIEKFNQGLREATVIVMNELAKAGPYWDGTFRNNWQAEAISGGIDPGSKGSYPYNISNIPNLEPSKEVASRVKKIEISNSTSYAPYAMDLQKGKFFRPNFPRSGKGRSPLGDAKSGTRDHEVETLRGDIALGAGGSQITAPLDWYKTYLDGGALRNSVTRGIKLGFKTK
tara:strand:+ start:58 stop:699 length:642 start_codon:yes stop_codon:yes gene_type:complete